MPPSISFQRYQRHFIRPLRTSRGEWAIREGFLLKYEDGKHTGYGEVAPIPEFGSETVDAAGGFLELLQGDAGLAVPEDLPCCAFALSCARSEQGGQLRDYPVAALLPAGSGAVALAAEKIAAGYGCLKWKVGVLEAAEEQAICRQLLSKVPPSVQLRLDPNASWEADQLVDWLSFLEPFAERIEFVEQPLAVGREQEMAALAADSPIAVALDESLNGSGGGEWLRDWEGPLVIKAALMGDCDQLVEVLRARAEQVVLSSVFETGIGLLGALRIADQLVDLQKPIGFDTFQFADAFSLPRAVPKLKAIHRTVISPQSIWKQAHHLT